MIRVPPIHTIPPPHRSDLTAMLRNLADTLDAEPTPVAALKLIRMMRDGQYLLASVLWDALQSGDALGTLSDFGLVAERQGVEVLLEPEVLVGTVLQVRADALQLEGRTLRDPNAAGPPVEMVDVRDDIIIFGPEECGAELSTELPFMTLRRTDPGDMIVGKPSRVPAGPKEET